MREGNPKLLVVEDDPRFRATLELEFTERGYDVLTASSLSEVKSHATDVSFRFATVDLRLEAEMGLPIVEFLKRRTPDCRIIVLTGYGSIATAVEAVKRGAAQYLTKPVQMDQLERLLWTDASFEQEGDGEIEIDSLARREREYIEWVLVQTQGNITEAARRLGIHRQSLQRKLRKFTPK